MLNSSSILALASSSKLASKRTAKREAPREAPFVCDREGTKVGKQSKSRFVTLTTKDAEDGGDWARPSDIPE